MSSNSVCLWLNTEFEILGTPASTSWLEAPGLYVFAEEERSADGVSVWRAIYVGQAQNFRTRMPTHEKWLAAVRLGATHVHAKLVDSSGERDDLERALIDYYEPPLNVQRPRG